jgi:hypothetical protein
MQKKSDTQNNEKAAFRVSRKAFQKINAVEGIDLDGRLVRQLEAFDGKGLTAAERRATIRAKHAKATA